MKLATIVGFISLTAGVADAQSPDVPTSMDSNDATLAATNVVQGVGVKVGDGTVINPTVGLQTGVVSNVFFEDASGTTAGIMRLLIEIGAGSLSPSRLNVPQDTDDTTGTANREVDPGAFQYQFNAYASWDQYLSGDDALTAQGGLGLGLLFRGMVNPRQTIAFSFLENFERQLRPTNFESQDRTNRDINTLTLRMHLQPQGRSLNGFLFYQNRLDLFEDEDQQFLNRFQHTLGARANYQWLPRTRFFTQVSQGYFDTIAGGTKPTSLPLTVIGGVETALTVKTMLQARIGYANGFYESGPSYGNVTGALQFGWQYSPLGLMTASYRYVFEDSINGNFYRDHHLQALIQQQLPPVVVFVRPNFHLRRYEGLYVMGNSPVRDDVILDLTSGLRYAFRNHILATLDYTYSTIITDFRYDTGGGALDDPGFSRHELFLGVRAAY